MSSQGDFNHSFLTKNYLLFYFKLFIFLFKNNFFTLESSSSLSVSDEIQLVGLNLSFLIGKVYVSKFYSRNLFFSLSQAHSYLCKNYSVKKHGKMTISLCDRLPQTRPGFFFQVVFFSLILQRYSLRWPPLSLFGGFFMPVK